MKKENFAIANFPFIIFELIRFFWDEQEEKSWRFHREVNKLSESSSLLVRLPASHFLFTMGMTWRMKPSTARTTRMLYKRPKKTK